MNGSSQPAWHVQRQFMNARMWMCAHKEGLPPCQRSCWPARRRPETVVIDEYGCRFAVQISRGHKTGFYLDQRENRALVWPNTAVAGLS